MDIFVARQPIFDNKKNVIAYELLYRDSAVNEFKETDRNKATAAVLANCFMEIGYDTMTSGKKAYVKFTEDLIKMGAPTLFPNDLIVIEILETNLADSTLIENCIDLKQKGYTLALDNFEYKKIDQCKSLLKIVDIVRVNWARNTKDEQKKLMIDIRKINSNILFLAEKIETEDKYIDAIDKGYSLFQGYFFSKPVIVQGIRNQNNKMNYMIILNEISSPSPDFEKVAEVIERDPVLTLQLLKLINSVAFRSIQTVTSIHDALVRLGINEIKKWISVLMLREVTGEKPVEIMRLSLVRAYFMELLANATDLKNRKSETFIFGLFSMIDVLFDYDRVELLKDIPINEDLKAGLLGEENQFTDLFNIVLYYEKGEWENLEEHIKKKEIKITAFAILSFYYEAINLANKIIEN